MHNNMTFKGERKPWLYLLEGRRKPPFAGRRRNLTSLRVGARLRNTHVDPLPISQPIGFKVENDQQALQIKDELAEWLVTDEPVPLQFDDEPGRTYYALVENTVEDLERFAYLRWGTIQFICLDPYGYGEEKELTAGISFNSHTVTGQVTTPWTSRTVFPATATTYTLETNQGGKITLNFGFIQGDVLTIDYKKRKVKLNGNDLAVSISLNTRWFELTPGEMQLRASHETTVSYTERYY